MTWTLPTCTGWGEKHTSISRQNKQISGMVFCGVTRMTHHPCAHVWLWHLSQCSFQLRQVYRICDSGLLPTNLNVVFFVTVYAVKVLLPPTPKIGTALKVSHNHNAIILGFWVGSPFRSRLDALETLLDFGITERVVFCRAIYGQRTHRIAFHEATFAHMNYFQVGPMTLKQWALTEQLQWKWNMIISSSWTPHVVLSSAILAFTLPSGLGDGLLGKCWRTSILADIMGSMFVKVSSVWMVSHCSCFSILSHGCFSTK